MKALLAILIFCALNLSANAFEKPSSHYCRPTKTQISCQLELALICGDGYVDGCLTQQTNTHECVLKDEGTSCLLDIAILCPEHFRDGCELGRTTRHQCVPVIGPACDSGEAFECPVGFQDTCNL